LPFFTAEIDPELAARAAELFADDPDVTVLVGPWQETLPAEAPFDLIFVDGGKAKDDVEAVIGILAPGGTAVLDDFWFDPSQPDPRRDAWLEHPLLATVELWVTRKRRALVSVRR
jgi:predicted O-methyltransferase YrrM